MCVISWNFKIDKIFKPCFYQIHALIHDMYITFIYLIISLNTGLIESLFIAHKDEYPEHEQASLRQLYRSKVIFIHF